MSDLRESRLVVNGVAGLITQAGNESDTEAVVCLHGVPGSGRDFQWLLPETAKMMRSIAIDLPGFGRADKPRDFPYSVEGYQTWLVPALNQLGVARAHLILHSFHGATGLLWAAMNPEKVGSVTLLSTGDLSGYRWNMLARAWKTKRLGEIVQRTTTRAAFGLIMRRGNWRGLDAAWQRQLYDENDRDTRWVTLALYRNTPEPGNAIFQQALRPRDIPALVIYGTRDPYISSSFAERQRNAFPSAQVHVWDDSGHFPHVQHPVRTAETVTTFLRSVAERM